MKQGGVILNILKKIVIVLAACMFLMACEELETTKVVDNVEKPITENTIIKEEQPKKVDSTEVKQDVVKSDKPPYYVQEPIGDTFKATVTKVTDGDTIKVEFDGKEESVRLLLIDTPETVHPDKPVQPFGKEASTFAKDFFPIGTEVEIDIDVSERDKYGRLLAYVWKDGVLYQDAILNEGLARVAYIYSPNTGYVDNLRENQKQAQKRAVGIWSIENYASESGFNETTTVNKDSSNNAPNSSSNASAGESKADKTNTAQTGTVEVSDANGDGICNDIKGNQGSSGWIYHIPGGGSYNNTKPEELFCTTTEAEDAGYRQAKR